MSKPDLSVLKRPIHLGTSGVQQIIECMETGTSEVKNALLLECDVILECKVCRNMFRALPNYLAHKRAYCQESYQDTKLSYVDSRPESYTVIVEPKSPVKDEPAAQEMMVDLTDGYTDVEQNINAVQFYDKAVQQLRLKDAQRTECKVELKTIDANQNAVLQHVVKEKPAETGIEKRVAETVTAAEPPVKKKKSTDGETKTKGKEATTGASKPEKLVPYRDRLKGVPGCNIKKLKCLRCKVIFSSAKTLFNHMVALHSASRTAFPCPCCKASFFKMFTLNRHLENQHNKSKQQIRRMKESIQKMAFQKLNENKDAKIFYSDNLGKKPDEAPAVDPAKANMLPIVALSPCSFKCAQCGRAFGKRDSLKRHLPFCMHRVPVLTDKYHLSPVKTHEIQGVSSIAPGSSNEQPELVQLKQPASPGTNFFAGFTKDMMSKIEALMDEDRCFCVKCDNEFDSVADLHRHVAKHLGIKRFKCKLCKFNCYNRSECKYHLQKVHPTQVAGFSLVQFGSYILDLNPEGSGRRLSVGKAEQAPASPSHSDTKSKRTLAFKSPKKIELDAEWKEEICVDRVSDSGSAKEEKENKRGDKLESEDDAAVRSEDSAEELCGRRGQRDLAKLAMRTAKTKAESNGEKSKKSVVKKKAKGKPADDDTLQVLSTRSGVKYKKPTLEEILKARDKQACRSDDDVSESEAPPVQGACEKGEDKSAPKATRQAEKRSNGNSCRRESARKENGAEQGESKSQLKGIIVRERPRSTPPRILSRVESSGAKGSPNSTVTPSPSIPRTASDILKQQRQKSSPSNCSPRHSPKAQRLNPSSPGSPPLKTFDLSKAKVILSPLMSPSTPSEQLKLSQSLLANPGAMGMVEGDLAGSPGKSPHKKNLESSISSSLPRLAPKPPQSNFIVLVDDANGVSKVLDAVNRAAQQGMALNNDYMYLLKNDALTPVSRAVAGMTCLTVVGNPVVAGSCKVIPPANEGSDASASKQTSNPVRTTRSAAATVASGQSTVTSQEK